MNSDWPIDPGRRPFQRTIIVTRIFRLGHFESKFRPNDKNIRLSNAVPCDSLYTGILRYEDAPLITCSACAELHKYELCSGEFQRFFIRFDRFAGFGSFTRLLLLLWFSFFVLFFVTTARAQVVRSCFTLQIPRFGSFVNKIFHRSSTNRVIAQKFTKRYTKPCVQKYWIMCIALLHILQRVHALKKQDVHSTIRYS